MARGRELKGLEWINSPNKRAMDVIVSLGSLPIAVPVGATALGLSRMIDGKGAIFRHRRVGQYGQEVTVTKIRTLKDIGPYEQNNGIYDEHATALGRALRLRGIDEIPQVTNVLSGEMSLVGPRIMPAPSIERMQSVLTRNEFDEWFEIYNLSKPGGISSFGLSYRAAETGIRDYRTKMMMDREDFNNASLRHDLGLIKRAAGLGIRLLMNTKFPVKLDAPEQEQADFTEPA